MSLTLTAAANSAAQFIEVIDSGGSLSSQQLTDALAVANLILANWTNEQTAGMALLIAQQAKIGLAFVAKQVAEGYPLSIAYTLAGGTYVAATYSAPTFTPSAVFQFPDKTTPISLPAGVDRALQLALSVELAPQYGKQASPDVQRQLAKAMAAAFPMPMKALTPGVEDQQDLAPPEPVTG